MCFRSSLLLLTFFFYSTAHSSHSATAYALDVTESAAEGAALHGTPSVPLTNIGYLSNISDSNSDEDSAPQAAPAILESATSSEDRADHAAPAHRPLQLDVGAGIGDAIERQAQANATPADDVQTEHNQMMAHFRHAFHMQGASENDVLEEMTRRLEAIQTLAGEPDSDGGSTTENNKPYNFHRIPPCLQDDPEFKSLISAHYKYRWITHALKGSQYGLILLAGILQGAAESTYTNANTKTYLHSSAFYCGLVSGVLKGVVIKTHQKEKGNKKEAGRLIAIENWRAGLNYKEVLPEDLRAPATPVASKKML